MYFGKTISCIKKQERLSDMTEIVNRYTVLREYENKYGINEMMKRIIRIHLKTMISERKNEKECSNHEVKKDENQQYG